MTRAEREALQKIRSHGEAIVLVSQLTDEQMKMMLEKIKETENTPPT
ncbi:MAG: hypothetical protein IJP94_00345 [Clostridia bacterium]|nr:hypothetical protein [Clostridia bacterium]